MGYYYLILFLKKVFQVGSLCGAMFEILPSRKTQNLKLTTHNSQPKTEN